MTCEADVLFSAIKANAHPLRHLFLDTMSIKNTLIRQLAKLLALKLDTMQVVDDSSSTFCDRALVRYINGEQLSKPFGHSSDKLDSSSNCDNAIHELREDDTSRCIVTQTTRYIEPDSDSDVDSEDFESPLARAEVGLACFFNRDSHLPTVFCYQVLDSHPGGYVTE